MGGNVETYEYDGHGRRTVTARSNGSVKVDYYTRDGVLRASADTGMGSTGGLAVYVHLGDVLVAQDAWAWRSPFGMTFFHVDHQGTPIARSDAWGTVFERTRRGSFGLPLVGPLKNGPGYTGHMEDPGTGLVYMQQRYYDPAIARFLSVDPVGPLEDPIQHFGRYHYAYNNPYKYTDPDGRCPMCIGALVGAALEVAVQSAEIASGQRETFDGGDILVSGAAGAVGVGLAQNIGRVARLGKSGIAAANAASDGAVSAGSQYAKDGDVSLLDTAVDVVSGQTVGRIVGDAAASRAASSAEGRILERGADRAERIAAGSSNPRQSRVNAAKEARAQQQGYLQGRAAAAGASASNTTSEAAKAIIPEDKRR